THTIFVEGKEAEIITGKKGAKTAITALHRCGVKNVLFKAENGLVFSDGRKTYFQPIAPVRLTDTTGVGDVIGAALIHFFYDKKFEIKKSLLLTELAAAVKVMHYGFYAPSFLEIKEAAIKLKWKV
ncbi:MAG: PfkB family carbohydrate kinase, partial [Candidatus Hadarchaeales archaeon]